MDKKAKLHLLPRTKPKSAPAVYYMIRGLLSIAFAKRITFIEVTYRTKEDGSKTSRSSLDVG